MFLPDEMKMERNIMHVKAAVEGKPQKVQFISQNLEIVIIMTKIAAA